MTREELEEEAREKAEEKEKRLSLGVYSSDEEAASDAAYNDGYVIGYEEGYIDGAEAHSVQWHDLRKNPEDLPKKDCEVIILYENGRKNIQKWKNGNWTNAIVIPVIKWCEMPEFEE